MSKQKVQPRYVVALEGGLTWPGHGVLLRGDVVELPESGSEAWSATCDRHGTSFLDDLSASAQCRRWGQVFLTEVAETDVRRPLSVPETDSPADAGVARTLIRAPSLETLNGPRNLRSTPEGTVPIVSGLYGDGLVEIVEDGGR